MNQWLALSQKNERLSNKFAEDEYIGEALLIVQYWLAVHQQSGKNPPDEFPLKAVWDQNADRQMEMKRTFLMETRGTRK